MPAAAGVSSAVTTFSPSAEEPHQARDTAVPDLAALIRGRLRRPPPPPPRADAALAKAALAILLIGLAATGAALLATRPDDPQAAPPQPARIGEAVLAIPRSLTGPEPEEDGRLVGMARLRLDWPSLGPVSQQTRHRLLVGLSPPDKVNEPATQLAVYARFLTPTVWSNPGGLVVRGFRKGSPFEADELYVAVPDGRAFAARCPLETPAAPLEEPCRATIRHRGLDVNIRFPRAIIAEWEAMIAGVRRSIDGMTR